MCVCVSRFNWSKLREKYYIINLSLPTKLSWLDLFAFSCRTEHAWSRMYIFLKANMLILDWSMKINMLPIYRVCVCVYFLNTYWNWTTSEWLFDRDAPVFKMERLIWSKMKSKKKLDEFFYDFVSDRVTNFIMREEFLFNHIKIKQNKLHFFFNLEVN